jgi:phage gpG-like protein
MVAAAAPSRGGGNVAGVTFDKSSMTRALNSLAALSGGKHVPILAQLISVGGLKLTMDCFRNERDPYGKPWKPLQHERIRDKRARLARERKGLKSRGHKILQDTGRMRNSAATAHRGNTAGVVIATGYAAAHQNGARIAPHTRLKSYGNVTYRSGNRFISESAAAKARKAGANVQAGRFNRTFAQGITIPQRMMIPDVSVGLPASWHSMIARETGSLLKRWLNKGEAK